VCIATCGRKLNDVSTPVVGIWRDFDVLQREPLQGVGYSRSRHQPDQVLAHRKLRGLQFAWKAFFGAMPRELFDDATLVEEGKDIGGALCY
jgi:hypothetical protein